MLAVPGRAGFFFDDAAAIAAGATHDGFLYVGEPVTTGFRAIRQPGEALSVLLMLEDGQVAHGDCAAVQYSGVGGRDPLFDAVAAARVVEQHIAPLLVGADADDFRGLNALLESVSIDDGRLHTAIRYGVSQALLDGAARSRRLTMAEVVRADFDTGVDIVELPMFVQSGDQRYDNVDKMILKGAGALPHGLVNHVGTKLGTRGEILAEYVGWVRDRILALRTDADYTPTLHFDVYGTVGVAFGQDTARMADYLVELEQIAAPFALRVEQPMDAGSRSAQIEAMAALRRALRERASGVALAIDEWCNTLEDIRAFVDAEAADVIHVKTPDLGSVVDTVEALLLVRRAGLTAYAGGTCNETDRSAQVCTQVAMACGALQVLAKPGMGVDEGMSIVGNEMARTVALIRARSSAAAARLPQP